MIKSNFKSPSKGWVLLTYSAGLLTAIAGILGLEFISDQLSPVQVSSRTEVPSQASRIGTSNTSQSTKSEALDISSMELPGIRVRVNHELPENADFQKTVLSAEERVVAQQAWRYFERNLNSSTGLVNSVDGFASVTLWDQSAAIAALVSAYELKLIPASDFKPKLSQMLTTLAKLPLYQGELPNKVYNAKTLIPVNYGELDQREEIGWSAIDLGRMALWLKIIGARYPELKPNADAIWQAWDVKRLTQAGQMYGTSVVDSKEQYHQEGRLGYENYAAYGLSLWGQKVEQALDFEDKAAFVKLYGQSIPFDIRDQQSSGANNYVLSEPYFLDGIETGFQSLPKAYADQILAAQESRYQSTQQLTALTEDNLDRPPFFVYNTLFVNGKPWGTIRDTGENYNHLRFLSTKAAIGWHVLYDSNYTRQLFSFVQEKLGTEGGWYSGYYETLQEPNAVLTANNNGIILESLLFKQVGQPLIQWAGVE